MTLSLRRAYLLLMLAAAAACLPLRVAAQIQQEFIQPTQEELKMTAQPEVPGAAAVYLNREEITDDSIHTIHVYARIKVLTDAGKKYGDVEVGYEQLQDSYTSVIALSARTIHPDGTVIPFTGKPYSKLVSKTDNEKHMAKVFSLPDVQVGSILEYRYSVTYDDHLFLSPEWDIQSELYTRKAHFLWRPTTQELMGPDGKVTHFIAWSSMLPHGTQISKTEVPAMGQDVEPKRTYELTMTGVPAIPSESYMPPMRSLSSRVYFYYTAYTSSQDFWKSVGKAWSKSRDSFMNPSSLTGAVNGLVAVGDTDDQKLHKIYAAMMTVENTDFTRERTSTEDRAATGHAEIHGADDIWKIKRGSSDQIAELFVAMARAAHLKAYLMKVSDRSRRVFLPDYMSLGQLDDEIAIVDVGGKEQFFDPGARYCEYGHLAWQHTSAGGLRQTESGTSIDQPTPGESYKESLTQRAADLAVAPDGSVNGTVMLVMSGSPALRWREEALTTDDAGIRKELKETLEQMLPSGLEIDVASTGKLADYDSKLVIQYNVKGSLGSMTGKRMILPADPFAVNQKATFSQDKRITPIYFRYPYSDQDITRFRFPAGYTVESSPAKASEQYRTSAINTIGSSATPNSITVEREVIMADTLLPQQEYSALRDYYSKLEQRGQENVVLTLPAGGN